MSAFKPYWRTAFLSFCFSSLVLWLGISAYELRHPQGPCSAREKDAATQGAPVQSFGLVNPHFWSSLCSDRNDGLIISASEGSGSPAFSQLAMRDGFRFDEFSGAHRGIKTAAYLMGLPIHPERTRRLRVITLVNPVYFDLAAGNDPAALRRSASSPLAYLLRVFHPRILSSGEMLSSPFVTAKTLLQEHLSTRPQASDLKESQQYSPAEAPGIPDAYDLEYNMKRESVPRWKSFAPRFEKLEPTSKMLEVISRSILSGNTPDSCVALLPVNGVVLRKNGVDVEKTLAHLRALFSRLSEHHFVDLTPLSFEPYLFSDSMHFTPYGKMKIWSALKESGCFKKIWVAR